MGGGLYKGAGVAKVGLYTTGIEKEDHLVAGMSGA